MKFLKATALICLIATSVLGQKIEFDDTFQSWATALNKAKTLRKPIFIDFYTVWCGPCRNMEMNIFTRKDVADFYNDNFISIKIDAEKGWGKILAKKNKINAYPTLMYFSQSGDLLLESIGFVEADIFISLGKSAIKNWTDGVNLRSLESEIDRGNNDSKYLLSYIRKLSPIRPPNSLLIEKYLNAIPQDSLYNKATLNIVMMGYEGYTAVNSKAFKVLYAAYTKYPVKSRELMSPWSIARSRILENIDSAGFHHNVSQLNELLSANDKLDTIPYIARRERDFLLCNYYFNAGDWVNFNKQAQKFASRYITQVNASEIYKYDSLLFREANKIKFSEPQKSWSYSTLTPEQYKATFTTESQRSLEELNTIVANYQGSLTIQSNPQKLPVRNWTRHAVKLYKNNPIFINQDLVAASEAFMNSKP